MARNSIPEGAERTPIHLGEHLLTPGYGAEIQLKIPATIEGPKSSHTSRGRLWLTDERVSSVGPRLTSHRFGSMPPWCEHVQRDATVRSKMLRLRMQLTADRLHRQQARRRRLPLWPAREPATPLAYHPLRTSSAFQQVYLTSAVDRTR